MTCGHCGCAVVAEIHKGKYIYYRCTHNKGQKCPDRYVREEVIDEQFTESLRGLYLEQDVVDWIVEVMNQTTAEERQQRVASITALNQRKQKLEARLERIYLDKLDGLLDEEEYRRLSNRFRNELSEVKCNLDQAWPRMRHLYSMVSAYSNSRRRPSVFTLRRFRKRNANCFQQCTRTQPGRGVS